MCTTDMLIYIAPTRLYNMAPYPCFRAAVSIDEAGRKHSEH